MSASSDRWGSFADLCARLSPDGLAIVDSRVAKLKPSVLTALTRRLGRPAVVQIDGGEAAKRLAVVEKVLARGLRVSREGVLIAVGGGTIGDMATVAAHLLKRGVKLVLVPTTLLAAVDSSLGGKGAVNLGAAKNAAGVFHPPFETWVCEELLRTQSPAQIRDGQVEAWKMAVSLDGGLWRRWRTRAPTLSELIRESRRLKGRVCAEDPTDRTGARAVLNFGHTFGHVLESLTAFRLSHGAAVRLGVLCALDIGRAMGVTADRLAREGEAGFERLCLGGEPSARDALARALRGRSAAAISTQLRADKKTSAAGGLRMVLLARLGRATLVSIPTQRWRGLLPAWREGRRP